MASLEDVMIQKGSPLLRILIGMVIIEIQPILGLIRVLSQFQREGYRIAPYYKGMETDYRFIPILEYFCSLRGGKEELD